MASTTPINIEDLKPPEKYEEHEEKSIDIKKIIDFKESFSPSDIECFSILEIIKTSKPFEFILAILYSFSEERLLRELFLILSTYRETTSYVYYKLLKDIIRYLMYRSVDECIFFIECCEEFIDEKGDYECLSFVIKNHSKTFKSLPSPIQVEKITRLLESEKYNDIARESMKIFLSREDVGQKYKYSSVSKLVSNKKIKKEICVEIFVQLQKIYELNKEYQYLPLVYSYLVENKRIKVSDFVYLLKSGSTNIQAEIADMMIRYGDEMERKEGINMIKILSKETLCVYKNEQNVHDEEVTKSVKIFMTYTKNIIQKTAFPLIKEKIHKMCFENKEIDSINASLFRIETDSSTYDGLTLKTIFEKMWEIIQNHPQRNNLEKRLITELIDINQTTSCFSGHINRLVNTFSSFVMEFSNKEFQVGIGIKSDMKAKLFYILSKDLDEKMLASLTSDREEERKIVNEYLRVNLSKIIEKLREMMGENISTTEFDEQLIELLSFVGLR